MSMLAIARPNPFRTPKASKNMLRRISSSTPSRRNANEAQNPSSRTGRRGRLQKALEARRGRSNSSQKKTLKSILAKHSARQNSLPARAAMLTDLDAQAQAYRTAVVKAKQSPTITNRKIVARQKSILEDLKSDLDSTISAYGRKKAAPKRKKRKAMRKKTTKSAISARTKKGVASTTTAYKRIRKAGKKSKFTRAFNLAYKSAIRRGVGSVSAQRTATSAGKRALTAKAKSSRKNPTTVSGCEALRTNPSKKKSKSTSAKSSKFYTQLRSSAKKSKFVTEYNKLFRQYNKRRGVSAAQASAWAAFAANAKVKAGSVKRSSSRKATTTRRKSTSTSRKPRTTSAIRSKAKQSSFYKKLKTDANRRKFVSEFNKLFKKYNNRKGVTESQAAAWAGFAANSKVKAGTATRSNPSRKSTKPRKARAKRMKKTMSKSAIKVLSKYGPYTYRVTINGKVVELKASKSSKEYKAAKRSGLKGVKLTRLRGKKNTPTSLNLRTVYKVTDGRPSRKDFQRAINAWAGAIDGGKIQGVSKRDIQRSRANPVRKHSVSSRANPAPMSAKMHSMIQARQNEMSGMDRAKVAGVGAIAFGSSLYLSNFLSSVLSLNYLLNVTAKDKTAKKFNYLASEGLPVLVASAGGGYGLYRKYVQKANVPPQFVALCGGIVAGSVTSLLARTVLGKMADYIPGFNSIKDVGSTVATPAPKAATPKAGGYLVDNQYPQTISGYSAKGSGMTNRIYGTSTRRIYGNHKVGRFVRENVGAYVSTPARSNGIVRGDVPRNWDQTMGIRQNAGHMGLYERVPVTGAYVNTQGTVVGQDYALPQNPVPTTGAYVNTQGTTVGQDFAVRQNPVVPQGDGISPVGANTQMVPNQAPAVPHGIYNIDYHALKEDLDIYDPLTSAELIAEGLEKVTATQGQLRVIRATPDVARQVVEANFGSIIGTSRAVPGSVLVLASIYDHPQNPMLTDRLRLNRAPEVPKGASFPQAGGVFSRVAFSSLFPSINNQASFQEFGVVPNR